MIGNLRVTVVRGVDQANEFEQESSQEKKILEENVMETAEKK